MAGYSKNANYSVKVPTVLYTRPAILAIRLRMRLKRLSCPGNGAIECCNLRKWTLYFNIHVSIRDHIYYKVDDIFREVKLLASLRHDNISGYVDAWIEYFDK